MRKQINSHRRNAKLDNPSWVGQVGGLESWVLSAKEVPQSSNCSPRVCGGRVQENIKVFCGARLSVVGDGVRADDQVPDPMSI